MKGIIFFLLGMILIAGCRNYNTYKEEDLFFDYKILAEEGSDSAAVMVQFRLRRITGPAVQLEKHAGILFDGEEIPLAKAKVTGAYYAFSKHISQVTGTHSFTYISPDGTARETDVGFHPFQLTSALPDTIHGSGLELEFSGLDSLDQLDLLLNDTSFRGEGVNRSISIRNNHYTLSPAEISSLSPGPLQLELQKSREYRYVKGVIVTSYAVRRELWLKK